MKTTKLIFPLILALAATLATTGCKHKPVGLTKLPGQPPPRIGEPGTGGTMGNAGTVNEGVPPGGGELAKAEEFDNMLADRAALAADTIHFAYDSSVIRSSEKPNLAAVAQALSTDPGTKLLIEGNCDERGTEEYNRSLGERRALAAREALAKLGVDPMRVETRSFGKDKPVDPGHDESAWSKNRRDDFVLLHPKAGS
ncbi:MAG: OmpA family protein [Verrucomicrobiota bacterium]|jgi:peptidoglycan-associated lipoprotein